MHLLYQAARPTNRCVHGALGVAEAEEHILAVLGKKAGTGLQHARLAAGAAFNGHGGSDGVAIALGAAQSKCNRRWQIARGVLQQPELRSIAILQDYFEAAIMIEIGEREGAAILDEIKPHHGGGVRKRSIAIVHIKDIALVTAPGAVGADKFVNRVPSLLVLFGSARFIRRIGNDLSPEKAVEIRAQGTRHHAVGDEEIGEAIVIKVERVA